MISKTKFVWLFAIAFLGLTACEQQNKKETQSDMSITDPHSYAQPGQAKVTHLDWKAIIDFDSKKIKATATLQIETSENARQLVLDTKDLTIREVSNGNNEILTYAIGETKEHLGAPLNIDITPDTKTVNVTYESSPSAEAVQWLNPAQTADKKQPFLFTQSQAILARSWIPIQDSPGIRFTYNAEVTVPKDLIALMSARNPTEKNESGVYTFEMKQPIPAYLMALAVGDVQFASLGNRSGVYAEPSVLESAAYEFEDLEKMIDAAENLYGPYQWEQYDLIVLPPSFPFGGMENPRLTFATPTILAGDKSLTSLVAHELAHSWSGNLVTNATWDDFWLNEGFTVYFEYRIMESLYGKDYVEMLTSLDLQDLKAEIEQFNADNMARDTHLRLDLAKRNPDDGLTTIAYNKGYFFLRLLEETVGRDKWDEFLKNYFTSNAFNVMTTEKFLSILKKDLFEAYNIEVKDDFFNEWVFGPGLPANCPTPVSDKFATVEKAIDTWNANQNKAELVNNFSTDNWSSHEWLHFVRNLDQNGAKPDLSKLDDAFGFTNTGNSEVYTAWAVHVIEHQYEPGYANLENFLIKTGRRKFLMPLYKEMVKTPEGIEMAKVIYEKARPNYHFVSYSSIDALLGIE